LADISVGADKEWSQLTPKIFQIDKDFIFVYLRSNILYLGPSTTIDGKLYQQFENRSTGAEREIQIT
jgi:hypothetical protein